MWVGELTLPCQWLLRNLFTHWICRKCEYCVQVGARYWCIHFPWPVPHFFVHRNLLLTPLCARAFPVAVFCHCKKFLMGICPQPKQDLVWQRWFSNLTIGKSCKAVNSLVCLLLNVTWLVLAQSLKTVPNVINIAKNWGTPRKREGEGGFLEKPIDEADNWEEVTKKICF